jgi:exodeoxyribonuclease VII large subunit
MERHTLFELNEYIRQVLALNLPDALWVSCELFDASSSKGHWYLSLVQKSEDSDEVQARAEGIIWRKQYLKLQRKIGKELQQLLQPGTEVLLQVRVDFHERYGYKLLVEDIDLSYTLGQMELQRRATLERLQKEQLTGRNRLRTMPVIPQRLAVISAQQAAGLQDFLRQLEQNEYGYKYYAKLFPAAMQGLNTSPEVIKQLQKIEAAVRPYDAVVIIRGGGARLDLAAFDDYALCKAVAECALPVIVGIGHEVDDVLLDQVAHTSLKTPTAAAEYLLNRSMQLEAGLQYLGQDIGQYARNLMQQAGMALERFEQQLQLLPRQQLNRANQSLQNIQEQLAPNLRSQLRFEQQRLEQYDQLLQLLSPEATLARGYSLTLKDGAILRSSKQAKKGDTITTRFKDGDLNSEVR